MLTPRNLKNELAALGSPERAKSSAWFFKTGKGEYGEGDQFLGVTVPAQRKVARRFLHLTAKQIASLLRSPIHEHRFTATRVLVSQYERANDDATRQQIFDFYVEQARLFNNWDLVDTSAPYIVGEHLRNRPRDVLYHLARSANLWERRIAVVSTLRLVKFGELDDAFQLSELLLGDRHDLIRKAVGWVLRETGRVSRPRLLRFLEQHYASVSRTALRYAIEHLPPAQRKQILTGRFVRFDQKPKHPNSSKLHNFKTEQEA